jgi:xylan 1,4-beta-xylosidase
MPEEHGDPREVRIVVHGLSGAHRAVISRLDPAHGVMATAYAAMGRPVYPSRAQIMELRRSAVLPPPETQPMRHGEVTIVLPPQGLALVEWR